MILALNKQSALHVFSSAEDAERCLEAIDVQQDDFKFCDDTGRRYAPAFTCAPRIRRLTAFDSADIGSFKLVAENGIDAALPDRFIEQATHIEHTSFSTITSIETLRNELHRQAQPHP